MKLVFLDTETTGLDADRHDAWEIGAIARTDEGDHEYAWQLRPSLHNADPTALRIGRFYQRNCVALHEPGTAWKLTHPGMPADLADDDEKRFTTTRAVINQLVQILDGAHLIGAVPWFDERFLISLLRNHNHAPTHHYHLTDVESLAAGALGIAPPWKLDTLMAAHNVPYDPANRHTALGDARMVRDLYDTVMTRNRKHP